VRPSGTAEPARKSAPDREHRPGSRSRPGEIVRAGHPLLKGREEHVEPVESFGRFDVEQATAAPGEKR
jgi:hypothetical protein